MADVYGARASSPASSLCVFEYAKTTGGRGRPRPINGRNDTPLALALVFARGFAQIAGSIECYGGFQLCAFFHSLCPFSFWPQSSRFCFFVSQLRRWPKKNPER